jgi:hypothetical protein
MILHGWYDSQNPTANYGYWLTVNWDETTTVIKLYKFPTLGYIGTYYSYGSNKTTRELVFHKYGTTIKFFIDNVIVFSWIDGSPLTGGTPGCGNDGWENKEFYVDDFIAGSYAPVGPGIYDEFIVFGAGTILIPVPYGLPGLIEESILFRAGSKIIPVEFNPNVIRKIWINQRIIP